MAGSLQTCLVLLSRHFLYVHSCSILVHSCIFSESARRLPQLRTGRLGSEHTFHPKVNPRRAKQKLASQACFSLQDVKDLSARASDFSHQLLEGVRLSRPDKPQRSTLSAQPWVRRPTEERPFCEYFLSRTSTSRHAPSCTCRFQKASPRSKRSHCFPVSTLGGARPPPQLLEGKEGTTRQKVGPRERH